MIIDCQSCEVREIRCADCVVTALLGHEPMVGDDAVDLDSAEQVALGVLAESGLVSPLRLIAVRKSVEDDSAHRKSDPGQSDPGTWRVG